MSTISSFFNSAGFLPHGYCLLWRPDILALHATSDLVIAAAYFSIPIAILSFVRRRADLIAEHRLIAILFSTFILGCGLTHVLGVVILWRPIYAIDGLVKAFTALVSIVTAVALWPVIPRLLQIPSPGQLATANTSLRAEVAARTQAVDQLRAIRAGLEIEIERRTREVKALAHRFEIATDGSLITVSEQDQDLRYTWLHNPRAPLTEALLGQTDAEALEPGAATTALEALKREVLRTGERLRTEVALPATDGPHYFEMTMTPAITGTDKGDAGQGLLVASMDITDQKREQERQQVIARELVHRAKNVLSLVDGIARQSIKAENLPEAVIVRFTNRLAALARAYDLLVTSDWAGIDLPALVQAQLGPMLPEGRQHVSIDGPSAMVSAEVGQYLALALHELATNALKYGALAQPDGRLSVAWNLSERETRRKVEISWIESGAAIEPPARRGFGRLLLETIVPRALRGEASLDFNANGLVWRVVFNEDLPLRAVR